MTKVIIIAAGTGSRLKPLTDNSPKAMLNVGNTTIIENQIKISSEGKSSALEPKCY